MLAWLLLAGWSSSSWAGWPTVPTPPQTDTADVASHIVFNGLDMRAKVFETSSRPDQVLLFYRQQWGAQMVVNPVNGAQVIGHREGDYFVTIEVKPDGAGSKGQLGIVHIDPSRPRSVLGQNVPHPQSAAIFNDISYPDDPVPARTVGMLDKLSPRQNADFFRNYLNARGWKPADENQCHAASCVLNYSRGDSKMVIIVLGKTEMSTQVVINMQNPVSI